MIRKGNMKKSILVVEDELALQKAVTKTLAKKGMNTYAASSAEEAISHLEKHEEIGAIWLDHYLLQNDTGLDFLREIRESKRWKGLPVFVVTNSVADDKVKKYHELGVDNYFIKADTSIYKIINDVADILEEEIENES